MVCSARQNRNAAAAHCAIQDDLAGVPDSIPNLLTSVEMMITILEKDPAKEDAA